ncbi:hypothetical protein SIAM614_08604 [Stappia aggregata IAM 12614]|uniref:Uncharacterized protein n=1 Tax=Roseibium aggregatum (strain ATCC 25650 / DSM 13394 / JCM 20685 / NBRC 16684 / NCIMB 2208 / IAM 12614 / B1) TaxID=384765 RepID=A0P284_ROSAI|nr:hypothetical protein SIAM614_08604 [Stappia aggregata IAM 12614] [Roseibium aggregatum IAM 12614]
MGTYVPAVIFATGSGFGRPFASPLIC